MRIGIASMLAALALTLAPVNASPAVVQVPVVADGDLPFCSVGTRPANEDGCTQPEGEYEPGRWARRHTHVGVPYVQETPPVHGWGVPPGIHAFEVPEGAVDATLEATVAFGWDQSVPGGAGNDVHLHLWDDEARTTLAATTFGAPPLVSPRSMSVPLEPGSYWLQEDVFFGEHTWWLTNATLTYTTAG